MPTCCSAHKLILPNHMNAIMSYYVSTSGVRSLRAVSVRSHACYHCAEGRCWDIKRASPPSAGVDTKNAMANASMMLLPNKHKYICIPPLFPRVSPRTPRQHLNNKINYTDN